MMRLPKWRARLDRLLDELRPAPFAYGALDCGPNWSGRLVEAILGIDPAAPFRGRYNSPEGALELIAAEGCADLAALVSKLLSEATGASCDIHPSQARLGDLAGVPSGDAFGVMLCIVNGERLFAPGLNGTRSFDRSRAVVAWRIGDA